MPINTQPEPRQAHIKAQRHIQRRGRFMQSRGEQNLASGWVERKADVIQIDRAVVIQIAKQSQAGRSQLTAP